jgi:hypothetical protein
MWLGFGRPDHTFIVNLALTPLAAIGCAGSSRMSSVIILSVDPPIPFFCEGFRFVFIPHRPDRVCKVLFVEALQWLLSFRLQAAL